MSRRCNENPEPPAEVDDRLLDDLRVVMERRSVDPCRTALVDDTVPGRRLAQYEVGERLGEGGMARVYRATDTKARREVALKVLKPEYHSSKDIRARFEQEAMSMARVTHDNVVRVFECLKDRETTAIAMELLTGGSLRELLETGRRQRQRFSIEAVARFAGQAASGLGAAHRVGIVHRDIKPANLMLDAAGT
ncbi:MAG: serine/threonine protein kinase, partial [Phycisphaerales bacterium]